RVFLAGIEKFPFYDPIIEKLQSENHDFQLWEQDKKHYQFVKVMLREDHFDFCAKPKGVLPFHKYNQYVATATEEHLNEAVYYSNGRNNETNLHFTVTQNHQRLFEEIIEKVKPKLESQSGSCINTSFSYQDSATDTIAVDLDNRPFRH